MTSPAQKAADRIVASSIASCSANHAASIIQQAITEAVDAAVAQERAKYLKLAEKWRVYCPRPSTPISATQHSCASELESLVKEPK